MASGAYGAIHKYFLQCMMSRSIIPKTAALLRISEISAMLGFPVQGKVTERELSETVNEINQQISNFGMELKEIRSEFTSEEHLVFINVVDNSSLMEKVGHIYSVKERDVFRILLERIVTSESYGSLPVMEAVNSIPSMRPSEVQDIMDKLISDQWFSETSSGLLVCAPRCIAEFDLYFKKNFHEYVQLCTMCSNVVFYGVMCPHCDSISHKHCFRQFNKRKEGQGRKCPTCKAAIVAEIEGADNENAENETPQQAQRGPKRARKGRTPETPQNTPAPSGLGTSALSQESTNATPEPQRNRRKRPSS